NHVGHQVRRWKPGDTIGLRRHEPVAVRRNLRSEQRYRLAAACLSQIMERQPRPLARMHRRVPLHVGKGEVGLAVPSVRRTEKGKERRVLREGQDLTIAERPAFGSEVEWENSYFGNERVGHGLLLSSVSGKFRRAR